MQVSLEKKMVTDYDLERSGMDIEIEIDCEYDGKKGRQKWLFVKKQGMGFYKFKHITNNFISMNLDLEQLNSMNALVITVAGQAVLRKEDLVKGVKMMCGLAPRDDGKGWEYGEMTYLGFDGVNYIFEASWKDTLLQVYSLKELNYRRAYVLPETVAMGSGHRT